MTNVGSGKQKKAARRARSRSIAASPYEVAPPGSRSIAASPYQVASPDCVAIGQFATVSGSNSIAIGHNAVSIPPAPPEPFAVDRLAALGDPDGPAAKRVARYDAWLAEHGAWLARRLG